MAAISVNTYFTKYYAMERDLASRCVYGHVHVGIRNDFPLHRRSMPRRLGQLGMVDRQWVVEPMSGQRVIAREQSMMPFLRPETGYWASEKTPSGIHD
jgi:hypothetical protein